jgi:hypothetical protein
MKLDVLMKYIIWIVVFGIASTGLYFMLRKLGVIGW